jgi:hypothetical protein
MQLKNLFGLTLIAGATSAQALVITPTSDTFAPLTVAQQAVITFTASGVNSPGPVAITTFGSVHPAPLANVTLALSATLRVKDAFIGPPVTDNGARTYYAQPGSSPAAGSNNAGWNFNYAVLGDTRGLTFEFYVDTNPGVGTDVQLLPGASAFYLGTGSSNENKQDSQNLGFFPWDNLFTFDPNAQGEYTFSIRALNGVTLVGEVSMQVNVVPEPEAYGLALAGMAVVGFFGLRRRTVPKA